MSGRRLVLVRHGITDWNRQGRFQGHLDPPLSADGRAQAGLVAERLAADPALRPVRVVSSSLARARQTGVAIAHACGVAVEEDPRLIEIGQGGWEGRTHAELAVEDAEHYASWRSHVRQPPGAEPHDEVLRRVGAGLADALGRRGPTCLVSHGGALRLLVHQLLDLSLARVWGLDLDNASLSVCAENAGGAWRLERWNDTHHLLGVVATHVDESEGEPLAL